MDSLENANVRGSLYASRTGLQAMFAMNNKISDVAMNIDTTHSSPLAEWAWGVSEKIQQRLSEKNG